MRESANPTPLPHGKRLTRKEAARFLGERGFPIAPQTLAKYAVIGGGPPFKKWGRRPLYSEADLLAWANAKLSPRKPTLASNIEKPPLPASAARIWLELFKTVSEYAKAA